MKTKNYLLFLLFLMLGTTTAFADKYYSVGSRVTGSLETGKMYMIYNTTFSGSNDLSGYLYNMGVTFGVKKFRSADKYICNGAFVFTLEDAGDNDPHTFYLKSLPSGAYIDVNGQQNVNPVVLNLYTWDEARNGDTYTASANGVTLTENGTLKQACVKSLNSSYTVVTEDNVTSENNAVYLIANEDNTVYFNGNDGSYKTASVGHPYAFYTCNEVTSLNEFDIQELHIYSRCDFYSVQKTYGYVQNASQITTSHDTAEGAVGNLIDGDFKTYNVTDLDANDASHYYQVNLNASVGSLRLYMACRSTGEYAPVEYELWASNSADDGYVKIDLDENNNTGLDTRLAYVSPVISLDGNYQYIRIYGTTRTTAGSQSLALSELYVLPNKDIINDAIPYFDNTVPAAASELEYKTLIDRYNKDYAAAKLFSGVPIPGNKYRIYADAYSDGAYVNRDLSTDGTSLLANGNYHSAGDNQAAFEWYCEESSNGELLFRNVKYPALYLASATVTTDVDSAKWEMNTNQTQHHGVPLINSSSQYLTVYNTGEYWMGDVKRVQSQVITSGTVDIKNTLNDDSDDVILTDSKGLCTDFVFIPVEYSNYERKLTIIASNLVNRNSTLTVGGTVYEIPFSRIFEGTVPEITVASTAEGYHNVSGFYKGDNFIGTSINESLYTNNTLVSGDSVEVRFGVANLPEKSTDSTIKLYRIKNVNGKAVAQQAGMSRADINYGDDEYVSMEGTKTYYYASFVAKDQALQLINDKNALDAYSFFYFTNDQECDNESYAVRIHSAITTFRYNGVKEWNSGGSLLYIQPNAVNGGNKGFAITKTLLNADNTPDAWCAEYSDSGDTVVEFGVEDLNSAWEFEEVDEDEAKEDLIAYIKDVAADMIHQLNEKLSNQANDETKINATIEAIEDIAGEYSVTEGVGSVDGNGKIADATVTALVGYAQELHMLHHEVEYAMQALPELTDEAAQDFQPSWYYVKNVAGSSYARYKGADNLMRLYTDLNGDADKKLGYLFYFAGDVIDKGTKDEYLQAHIHNFLALNLKDSSKDSTIVSYNQTLFEKDSIKPVGNGNQTVIELSDNEKLKSNAAWELTLEYNLASGAFFNGWGNGLIASGDNATIDKGTYNNGFQVYLQADGDVIIRGGDSDAYDDYRFEHTRGKYSHLKVVLSYAHNMLQVAVTNSEGVTQTIKDTPKGKDHGNRDYIPCQYMSDIAKLASAMSANSSFSMAAETVLAMKWNTRDGNGGDTWYILPSSNTLNPGLAIVTSSPSDTEMGWTNVNGENSEVFTAPGNNDYSTWQFEKVEDDDFEVYIEELLDMYGIGNCVIYNKELKALNDTLGEIRANGGNDELTFNNLFNALRDYTGKMPEDLKAPKPGAFYTVRPVADEDTKNALQVHVVHQTGDIATKEVYNGQAIDGVGDYDSRAAWLFEGSVGDGGLYNLNGLKMKNIHTQDYLSTLDETSSKMGDASAAVTLAPHGDCTASFKVGNDYMSMGDNTIRYTKETGFWGTALNPVPDAVNGVDFEKGSVYAKDIEIEVTRDGDVTVTFTHSDGNAPLNVLGVELVQNSSVVAGEYGHGTAGDNPRYKSYNLGTVAPGTYTLRCYVCDASGDNVNMAGGYITIDGNIAASTAKINKFGAATTQWIIEEIETPESKVYYNVPSLSSATKPDGRAYASLYLGFAAKLPSEITGWIVEGVNEIDQLEMESVEGIVPAGQGVILSSDADMTNQKLYYSQVASPVDATYNKLKGTTYTTLVECGNTYNIYMLGKKNDRIAMYWAYENYNADGTKTGNNNDGGYVRCNANKSYLMFDEEPESQVVRTMFSFFFEGNTTGIEESEDVNVESKEIKAIYDLQGRKLERIDAPGIYIIDGKKVYVTEMK